ncbi:membrane protein insertion efficiency factor YidD [candidate division WOR-3 bacterium]|nr:membrane protein insertion efficiency factor YidD [candidate division WOR-3 bacterium]
MRKTAFLALLLAGMCLAGYDALSVSGDWMIGAYKAVLSPLQGSNVCNFYPTCSQFARAAIRSQGFVPGVVMGADRLMRCNTLAWSYYDTYYRGDVVGGRMPDPVANHIAWRNPPHEHGLLVAAQAVGLGTRSETSDVSVMSRRPGAASLSFADYLYAAGEYYQAAGEYLRVRFTSSSSYLSGYAGLMAGESYLQAGDLVRARHAFQDLNAPAVQDLGRYGIARTSFAVADYVGTRAVLGLITSPALARQANALEGWTFFRQHRFAEGAAKLSIAENWGQSLGASASDSTRYSPRFLQELASMNGHGIRRRSRLASTLLSAVLPGAGQLYSGRAGDGAYSFLTVASTGLVTWWFASDPGKRDPTYVKVSIFGVISALFYAGNVYGANIAARDYNLLQEHRYVQRADSLFGLMTLEPDYHILLDSVVLDTAPPDRE